MNGEVVELVDTTDLKSVVHLNVRVRVPSSLLKDYNRIKV